MAKSARSVSLLPSVMHASRGLVLKHVARLLEIARLARAEHTHTAMMAAAEGLLGQGVFEAWGRLGSRLRACPMQL